MEKRQIAKMAPSTILKWWKPVKVKGKNKIFSKKDCKIGRDPIWPLFQINLSTITNSGLKLHLIGQICKVTIHG